MVGALVDRSVAHEAERTALESFVFEPVSKPQAQWCLAADDSMPAPVVFVGGEEVHRAAFAARATGRFSEKFRHAFIHAHAHGERVTVVAVGCNDMVVFAHERYRPDSNRLLSDIKVEKSAHHALVVILE